MKIKKRVMLAVGIIIAMVAIYQGALFLQRDMCMDSGGCWDEIDKVCRKSEPNAQELCSRSKTND